MPRIDLSSGDYLVISGQMEVAKKLLLILPYNLLYHMTHFVQKDHGTDFRTFTQVEALEQIKTAVGKMIFIYIYIP